MHILQSKQIILKKDEVEKLLDQYNISLTQLPKIKITDATLSENTSVGDVVKIERKDPEEDNQLNVFYRVVVL